MHEVSRASNELAKEELERFVDKQGLPLVLEALSEICAEKAAHVREAWQDESLAREWDRWAGMVNAVPALLLALKNATLQIEWGLTQPEKFQGTADLTLAELKSLINKTEGR